MEFLITWIVWAGMVNREESHGNGDNTCTRFSGSGDDGRISPLPCNWTREDDSTPRSSAERSPDRRLSHIVVRHHRRSAPGRHSTVTMPDSTRTDRQPMPPIVLVRQADARRVRARLHRTEGTGYLISDAHRQPDSW